jgi:hypothetical protein
MNMPDVAEILKFKEYKEQHGRDAYYYDAIAEQLQRALKGGHDVQLHIHSGYFNARHDGRRWVQDWSEYSFADLPYERMHWMVKTCKDFLETLLRPADPSYRCTVFRAANWSVSPSRDLARALIANNIKIDTSVFKYGRRNGLVNFDYAHAHSQTVPWRAAEGDMCATDGNSQLWESPIYSEQRWVGTFLTPNRIYRALMSSRHSIHRDAEQSAQSRDTAKARPPGGPRLLRILFWKHAWKADLNQCTGRQLIRALRRVQREDPDGAAAKAFVLIGHSKLFTSLNARSLRPFLDFIARTKHACSFARFDALRLGQ